MQRARRHRVTPSPATVSLGSNTGSGHSNKSRRRAAASPVPATASVTVAAAAAVATIAAAVAAAAAAAVATAAAFAQHWLHHLAPSSSEVAVGKQWKFYSEDCHTVTGVVVSYRCVSGQVTQCSTVKSEGENQKAKKVIVAQIIVY